MAKTPLLVVDRNNHLSKQLFTSVLQMKSSSTCLIPASLCEGPIFYFLLSQPIPLYLKQAFELLCFFHPYVDLFNHVYCLPLFSTMLLSERIYLWKLSMIVKRLLWLSLWFFCFVSSNIKGSDQNISIVCSLFSDQEQRFAITNHDLPCASLLWFLLLIASQIICREVAVYYDLCLGKCDASCPYFVYRHFTP
jgi:hypothetical protein